MRRRLVTVRDAMPRWLINACRIYGRIATTMDTDVAWLAEPGTIVIAGFARSRRSARLWFFWLTFS